MTHPSPPFKPLARAGGAGSPLESEAARLLAEVPDPAPLPAQTVARIGGRLAERVAPRPLVGRWRVSWATLALLGVAAATAGAGGIMVSRARRTAEITPIDRIRIRLRPTVIRVSPESPPAGRGFAPPELAPPPVVDETPAPAARRAPGRPAVVAPAREHDDLPSESRLLATALAKLRQDRNPRAALASLDEYQGTFPRGRLRPEAEVVRVEALLALDRRSEALRLLEGLPLDRLPSAREMRVLRGELRAAAGRCADALDDFARTLGSPPRDALDDRALFGQASCRAQRGDQEGARRDLERYLATFPKGRQAAAARAQLR